MASFKDFRSVRSMLLIKHTRFSETILYKNQARGTDGWLNKVYNIETDSSDISL